VFSRVIYNVARNFVAKRKGFTRIKIMMVRVVNGVFCGARM
jgi:hypothetical protein